MDKSAELAAVESPELEAVVAPAPNQVIDQILRFGIVGVLNTAVDLGVLNTLIFLNPSGRAGWLYAVFKTIAFLVAVTNSYLLNRRFTFRSEKAASSAQMS